jgi:hypothetical protein
MKHNLAFTRVIIESPYQGELERNERYLAEAMQDCLMRGESPYASHRMLTMKGVLNDAVAAEREYGMLAGFAWRECAHLTVFYIDYGYTLGMLDGHYDCVVKGLNWQSRVLHRLNIMVNGNAVLCDTEDDKAVARKSMQLAGLELAPIFRGRIATKTSLSIQE